MVHQTTDSYRPFEFDKEENLRGAASWGIVFEPPSEEALKFVRSFNVPSAFTETLTKVIVTPIRGCAVLQKEYAVTSVRGREEILGTFGLFTCLAVSAFNPRREIVGLAHLDEATVPSSLREMFSRINPAADSDIEVRVMGGPMANSVLAEPILSELQTIQGVKFASIDLYDRLLPSMYTIDARDGAVRAHTKTPLAISRDSPRLQRMSSTAMLPLMLTFDGRI